MRTTRRNSSRTSASRTNLNAITMHTSVIIPVRDGERFLSDAMSSVLSQLSEGDRLLVVDDGSTDGTAAIVRACADPRVTLLHSSGRGVSAARNLGFSVATGDFIAFLDHDDMWPPLRHQAMIAALLAHPEIDAAFGRVRVLLEHDARRPSGAEGFEGKHVCDLVGTGLYRKRGLDGIGGFAEDMHVREDCDFFLRFCEAGLRTLMCDVDGVIYRRHGANVSNDEQRVAVAITEVIRRKLARARHLASR
jgi:glycosyltransferase involved in cell wall biosynthesis